MDKEYLLDSASELGRQQLAYLSTLLDPHTTEVLDTIGVRAGQRCLDLGAGSGSITRWLASRTGPAGTVVAVDLDVDYLEPRPGVEVYRHDINDGLPVAGPFDLIHARLLLMHLSRRAEILKMLAGALAPGGWLVIGEFTGPRQRVVSAPSDADAALFLSFQERAHDFLGSMAGVSYDWWHQVPGELAAAGLTDVESRSWSWTTTGGDTSNLLNRNYALQVLDILLRKVGITEQELERYLELLLDPRFRAWFYEFVCTRARAIR